MAANKLLSIFELAEAIFLESEALDVIRFQRTNSTFRDTITNSIPLQRKLFMTGAGTTPDPTDPIVVQPYRLNTTLLMEPWSRYNVAKQHKWAKAYFRISPLQLCNHDVKFNPSCFNMQLADPPIRLLNMIWQIYSEDWDGNYPTERRIHTISQPDGVRFRHLVETLHLDELEHISIPPPGWIEVPNATFSRRSKGEGQAGEHLGAFEYREYVPGAEGGVVA